MNEYSKHSGSGSSFQMLCRSSYEVVLYIYISMPIAIHYIFNVFNRKSQLRKYKIMR
jgi:hypothetical protein